MSLSTVAVLARLLADAATTIELADEDAISLDLATVVLEDLAAGFGALSEGDRAVVALTIRDYAGGHRTRGAGA